jgi:zinc protease
MMKDRNDRRIGLVLATLLAAVGLALSTGAATAAEPTAEALLDGYVTAMGGKAAMEKIDNRVTHGKMEMAAQGIEMKLTLYSARPNLNYSLIESEMVGKIEKGTDGDVYWETSAMMGAQVKEGQERADYLRDSTFDKWLHWREIFPEVEYVGTEILNEKPVHKVVVKPESGQPQTLYFDQASNLALRIDLVFEMPMGVVPVTSYLKDYREIDGILIPYMMELEVMGQQRLITTDRIEHNVELPADRFALPLEIVAIVEKGDGEAAAEVESISD